MKSVMTHDFSRIPRSEIRVSTFNRSHGVKTCFNSGYLVPIFIDEVLPGDTFQVDAGMLAKMLSPMVSAPMDNIFMETFWFHVPSRILWNNFTRMMGERRNPGDSIDYLVPQITAPEGGFAVGSLADYFGIPTGVSGIKVSALPFRAYAKIWDDWFRCQQLQNCIINEFDDLGDGNPNNIEWNTLLKRGKRHDYFTSGLPSPQLGAGVELPLGSIAPVVGNGMALGLTDGTNKAGLIASNDRGLNALQGNYGSDVGVSLSGASTLSQKVVGVTTEPSKSGIVADLSSATAATINSLRMAFQLQRMLEADNRSGTRYVEILRSHFQVICPDARLQRSEYLGGSSQLINIHQVLQTSGMYNPEGVMTDPGFATPQGNRAAVGEGFDKVHWTKSFTEHGYVIGLVNIRVDLNYQQGLNRLWSRRGRYDFFWPTLENLGEQAILNKELFCQGPDVVDAQGNVVDDKPFAYQERYAEYRYHPSIITGKLRSTASGSLDVWHLAQYFSELPTLSAEFIEDSPPISRVLAVQDEPEFLFDAYIGCKCTRPMGMYSVPGLIDHM